MSQEKETASEKRIIMILILSGSMLLTISLVCTFLGLFTTPMIFLSILISISPLIWCVAYKYGKVKGFISQIGIVSLMIALNIMWFILLLVVPNSSFTAWMGFLFILLAIDGLVFLSVLKSRFSIKVGKNTLKTNKIRSKVFQYGQGDEVFEKEKKRFTEATIILMFLFGVLIVSAFVMLIQGVLMMDIFNIITGIGMVIIIPFFARMVIPETMEVSSQKVIEFDMKGFGQMLITIVFAMTPLVIVLGGVSSGNWMLVIIGIVAGLTIYLTASIHFSIKKS